MKKAKRTPPRRAKGRRPHTKKARGFAAAGIALLSITAILFIGVGVYAWALFSRVNYNPDGSFGTGESLLPEDDSGIDTISDFTEIEQGAASVAEISLRGNTKSITNILLVGIDTRNVNSQRGLSDAMIIMTIDSKNKAIKLTSLLRDTLVTIPGRDWNGDGKDDYAKLNAAYHYGGFDLLSRTIEQNFRLRISKFIAVNFSAFSAAVNHVGGVDLDLTAAEAREVGIGSVAKNYHLNGKDALEYARIRKIGNDYARTDRQRKVLTAMFKQAKSMGLGKLNNMLYDMMPKVATNMSINELMGFATNSFTYFSYSMDQALQFPPHGAFTGESIAGIGSVLKLSKPADTVIKLHEFIYIEN